MLPELFQKMCSFFLGAVVADGDEEMLIDPDFAEMLDQVLNGLFAGALDAKESDLLFIGCLVRMGTIFNSVPILAATGVSRPLRLRKLKSLGMTKEADVSMYLRRAALISSRRNPSLRIFCAFCTRYQRGPARVLR